ncbi:MAG: two-component sensor histidine kinase [Desulfobacterales bacterium S5133MH16]|nr:MAG: two-component sensor histidine kinase [Desulfobacterales bacterium S5133MH16]
MDTHSSEEKVKPFRLVKYFTFTSLTVIFIGTLLLSLLNTHLARTMQQKKSEEYAHLLIENLNHQVFLQFIIPVAMKFGKIQLSNKEQFERMDKVVRSTLHSFKIDMVNIYDINNTISYSFDTSVIGKEDAGGKGYRDALSGKSTSKLFQRGNWFEILLGFSQRSKLITFAPLRAEQPLSRISGPVLGVVEIVQDLTEDYKAIFSIQIRIITTCTVVMGTLFLVLLFVVKRGEAIIEKRALERIRLKEQLSRSEHLSSLGEMVAGISHEIRNPLGIIMSSSELLKKKMSDYDPSNPIPNIIIEESSRLNNIITDFLNFAKPRTPNLASCKIEDIIEKNITFLASQIKEEGYAIDKQYDNNLPEITADPDMLYQAFLNILINAMQAMPQGGKINVRICSNGNAVEIFFEDQGEGIAEDILEKIWDPFFTTKSKGTGLGLGIVKNIIESHGGIVQISNRSVSGARVTVRIPVEQGV